MEKNTMNPKVDWFFNKAGKWQEEYGKLRMITALISVLPVGFPSEAAHWELAGGLPAALSVLEDHEAA